MSLTQAIEISRQGLRVQRARMQLVSSNIANVSTTEVPGGGPYQRRQLVVEAKPTESFSQFYTDATSRHLHENIQGVAPKEITLDPSPFISKYEPDHPHADANGYVAYPNINPAIEMVDMVNIARSFEANLAAVRTTKQMISGTIELLRL